MKRIIIVVIVIILIVLFVRGFGHGGSVDKSKRPQLGQLPVSLSIGANGDMRVFGIMIDSINNKIITATSSIQNSPISFIIKTDGNMTVHEFNNATSSISNLAKGDVIIVAGTLESFGQTINLTAKDIKVLGNYQQNVLPNNNRLVAPQIVAPTVTSTVSNVKASTTKSTKIIKPIKR